MVDHIQNRKKIVDFLRAELVGPAPAGDEIDCSQVINFASPEQSYGPWRQMGSGEEILQRDAPTKRYGVGILYPMGTVVGDHLNDGGQAVIGLIAQDDASESVEVSQPVESLTDKLSQTVEALEKNIGIASDSSNIEDDFDLSTSNSYRPSSMGISFLATFPEGSVLVVEASGGRYYKYSVWVAERDRIWWLRKPVSINAIFDRDSVCASLNTNVLPTSLSSENLEELDVKVEVYSRPYGEDPQSRLITVCLVNRKLTSEHSDEECLFQSYFRASIVAPDGSPCILPYPSAPSEFLDEEEQSLALLYRHAQTYAVGHGCAAEWQTEANYERVEWVSAECLPIFETPSITSEIPLGEKSLLEVPMAPLAGLVAGNDGFAGLQQVVDLYSQWVSEKQAEAELLEPNYRQAAMAHINECARCIERMREGLNYLQNNPVALKAFQLANHAILLQQIRTRLDLRLVSYDDKKKRFNFTSDYPQIDLLAPMAGRGKWRAFQIAFLLMSIKSSVEGYVPDRKTVELIWFPTGGGKTEAYLGLAAFALFMRRLQNPEDSGVHVLMRYTLRLLTAQQFQRASGLVCAMEYLRRKIPAELGTTPFSIGIWVGGSNTPNKRDEAVSILNKLQTDAYHVENKFILNRCPWCGAQIGLIAYKGKRSKSAPRVAGYARQGDTVVFKCPDAQCEFTSGIPVYVIDEDIYEKRPSLIIGTVDKFAMLAWKPEARALFGINSNGEREYSPPGLIIQDELHLIAGPLGSMVGLYETVIEELCTDRRGAHPIPPKIVSSTATIRRYAQQIEALYGRDDVVLFPPPGLEASDSFFARYATDQDGKLKPGRLYVGIHAPGLGSLQTVQVRSFTALLQSPVPLPDEACDPWWTLLLFFNSLRELGTTLSLFQSDIPDYLKVMANRTGNDLSQMRKPWELRELTGRLRSDEIPEAISALEVKYGNAGERKPVDVCLASNILEVGIDIDRLSLMAVVGQPKTTSQYIQVTGRVGRSWWERPGMVVTIYATSKPRDRSHFEKFRSYHERLYAQVEPVSVTPFSPPSLDRALHAVMVTYTRQLGDRQVVDSPYPYPEELIRNLREIILARVSAVDPGETENFEQVFDKRAKEWKQWERTRWGGPWVQRTDDIPLLREAGAYVDAEHARLSWPTPTSMRNVDAECQAQITSLYLQPGE